MYIHGPWTAACNRVCHLHAQRRKEYLVSECMCLPAFYIVGWLVVCVVAFYVSRMCTTSKKNERSVRQQYRLCHFSNSAVSLSLARSLALLPFTSSTLHILCTLLPRHKLPRTHTPTAYEMHTTPRTLCPTNFYFIGMGTRSMSNRVVYNGK